MDNNINFIKYTKILQKNLDYMYIYIYNIKYKIISMSTKIILYNYKNNKLL